MLSKLILLYISFFQIHVPLMQDYRSAELTELAIQLEMHYPNEGWIKYHQFAKGLHDAMTLPSLKEAFLYDRGDGTNPLNPTIWWTLHGQNCRNWIDWLEKQKLINQQFGNLEMAQEIHNRIKDVEWVHSIYDKIDDLARGSYSPLNRRRAIKFVKERIGDEAFFKMELPRAEEYIWAHWKNSGGVK